MNHVQKAALLIYLVSCTATGFNHPEIRWQTATSRHFVINYYNKTESAVQTAVTIAEDTYEVLAKLYQYSHPGYCLKDKISLSLAEYDDYANGFASWLNGSIMIWLPDGRWDLRANNTWLRNVITHELTHIMTLYQKRQFQLLDVTIDFNLSSPDEQFGIVEPLPRITIFPMWLAEGIAQFETAQQEGDCFDSRREMLLRDAMLNRSSLTLEEMGHFNHDNIGNEMVYNQGFSFTSYLFNKVGAEKMHSIFINGGMRKIDFNTAFTRITGRSIKKMYQSWMDSLGYAYSRQVPSQPTVYKTISRYGKMNLLPKKSGDGRYLAWLSSNRDDGGRTDLMVQRSGKNIPSLKIPWAHTSYCFSSSSDKIYFVLSRTANRNGSYFNDMFSYSIATGKKQRVTYDGRIYDVAPLSGSVDVLVVSYRKGTFGLYRCNTATGRLSLIVPGEAGNPFLTIATHPDHRDTAIVSRLVGGVTQLYLLSLADNSLTPITTGSAVKESPFWGKDGRIYFSSDFDGIFNIYSILPDGSDLQRHTSTAGGFFSPLLNDDGTITASHFSGGGFSIVTFSPEHDSFDLPAEARCMFHPLPEVTKKRKFYPMPYVGQFRRSIWEVELSGMIDRNSSFLTGQYRSYFDTSQYLVAGVVRNSSTDALEKKQRLFQLTAGIIGMNTSYSENAPLNLSAKGHGSLRLQRASSSLFDKKSLRSQRKRPVLQRQHYSLEMSRRTFSLIQQVGDVSSDGDSSVNLPRFLPVVLPGAAYENNSYAPTFGIQVASQLLMVIYPDIISITPYIGYQLTREWSCEAQLELYSRPFEEVTLFGSLPLSLQWSHIGYYNEDFSYNGGDYSQMEISFGPQVLPGDIITSEDDTVTQAVSGFGGSLLLFHSIPLLKYGALQLLNYTRWSCHDSATTDDVLFSDNLDEESLLDGTACSYFLSRIGFDLVFPLNRRINSGTYWYNDALYASVGYQLFVYGNNHFFDHFAEIEKDRLLGEYRTDENIFVEHALSFGINLGHYKSYLFEKRHSLQLSYHLLSGIMQLSLTSGF